MVYHIQCKGCHYIGCPLLPIVAPLELLSPQTIAERIPAEPGPLVLSPPLTHLLSGPGVHSRLVAFLACHPTSPLSWHSGLDQSALI